MSTQESSPNSKQRIDMRHGFMKSVIRNQIDRDNYDREVKAQQFQGKPKSRSKKPKKPELQAYIPPQRLKRGETNGTEFLFALEYEHKNGDITKININQNDQSLQVARKIGMKYEFSEAFISALAQRIKDEINART